MNNISGVVCTFNEEDNIIPCLESMKGCDEWIVADDGSIDNTVKLAEELGAKVFRRHDHSETVTKLDVRDFKKRFKWSPSFKAGDKIRNGHKEYSEALSYAKNDWVLNLDADERVTWDFKKLQKIIPHADQITSNFVHSHDEKGNPNRVSTITKLFRKSVTKIEARTHSVIIPYGRIVKVDFMQVDHWQKPGHTQSYVLPIMEYSVLKDNDLRSRFYLGREYYYRHEYDKSLKLLNEYLIDATWQMEIGQARLYQARCYWESGRGDEARKSCLEAVLINPDHKEALYLMSELYFEPWKSKWAYIAKNATDKDILF